MRARDLESSSCSTGTPSCRTAPGARRRLAGALGALAVAAVALQASPAAANGRFPRAQRLIQDRANPALMALYGTYGLLVTRDGGASFRHVCEAATGPYAGEDPLLEIMAGERVLLRTDTGLSRSDASFCGYTSVLGGAGEALQDVTRDSASPDGLLALSTALDDDGVFVSSLAASDDGGETFTPLARVAPDVIELGLTLDVAAGQPELIYLSGFDAQGRGTLARSTDRGQSFVGLPIAGLDAASPPYIAAVSALDPARVFVRTDVFTLPNGDFEARETADDSLYFTPDGGETWHRVLNARGKLYGFALSPDERWVLAGFGDPVLPAIFVEPTELGLYRVALDDLVASPDAPPWERIYDRGVTCLRWTEQALFACLAQDESGFELGRAPDADFSLSDPAPFEGLLRLPEVLPLECPAESAGAACLTEDVTGWPATCNVLRAQCSLDGSGGEPDGADAPGPSAPGGGGAAGEPTAPAPSGGAGGAPPATGGAEGGAMGADGGGALAGDAAPRRGSGSCAAGAPGVGGWRAPTGLLGLWLMLARRRRRAVHAARSVGAGGALLLALAASLGAASLGACGDGAERGDDAPAPREPDPSVDCGGAGEAFAPGMSKASPDGELTVSLETAEPAPPLVGPNAWVVALSDASGAPVTGASVSLRGWMPQHNHGLSSVPLTRELGDGRYEIRPINLFMPQLWEFDVGVTRGAELETVTFSFCVR